MLVKKDKVTNHSDLPYRGDWFLHRSPDATLLVGKRRTATLATDDGLFSAALQRSPGATILIGTRVTANPANDEELRYDDLMTSNDALYIIIIQYILY